MLRRELAAMEAEKAEAAVKAEKDRKKVAKYLGKKAPAAAAPVAVIPQRRRPPAKTRGMTSTALTDFHKELAVPEAPSPPPPPPPPPPPTPPGQLPEKTVDSVFDDQDAGKDAGKDASDGGDGRREGSPPATPATDS